MKRIRSAVALLCLPLAGLLPGAVQAECREFSSSELRTMVIRHTIKLGVSAEHVERAWGEPTKIRYNSAGQIWEYWNPAGDELVEFDIHGCVTSWRTVRE